MDLTNEAVIQVFSQPTPNNFGMGVTVYATNFTLNAGCTIDGAGRGYQSGQGTVHR